MNYAMINTITIYAPYIESIIMKNGCGGLYFMMQKHLQDGERDVVWGASQLSA